VDDTGSRNVGRGGDRGRFTLTSGALAFDGAGNLTGPAANIAGITASGFADGANPPDLHLAGLRTKQAVRLCIRMPPPSSTSSTLQDGNKQRIAGDVQHWVGWHRQAAASAMGGSALVAQLALATFGNEQGLLRTGNNAFCSERLASGAGGGGPRRARGGRGPRLSGGALELSNVDIADGIRSADRGAADVSRPMPRP